MCALRRAQILAALRGKTAGIPGATVLWSELKTIEQVNAAAPLIFRTLEYRSRS